MTYLDTGLWTDVQELPAALSRSLADGIGFADAAGLLGGDDVGRIVATGNGAAYYVAHALWLASLEGDGSGPPIVAAPCGLVARDGFRWRPGDVVVAVSSSGEFRDVVDIVQRSGDRPSVAITADPESSLAHAATATVLQHVTAGRAVTHTQQVVGAYACGLAVWAAVTRDAGLRALLDGAPDAAAAAVATAEAWAPEALASLEVPAAAIAVGGGTAWAAALELALMLKEVSRVPAEGVEVREGATSAMFGLRPGHLMVSLDPEGDAMGQEAMDLCAAAGATTLRLPGGAADARLAPVTTLPAAAALAAELALAAGHDVDRPAWTDAYYQTARSAV